MGFWNNVISYAAVGFFAVGVVGQRSPANKPVEPAIAQTAQTAPQVSPTPLVQPKTSNSLRQLQLKLSVSSPQDLKVKQGDRVITGQVLADRVEERSHLTVQRQALNLSLKQIQARTIAPPPAPLPVPQVKQLPPISYAEEEAAISLSGMTIKQAERAFQLQQQEVKTAPLEESSAVTRASVEVQNRQRLVDNQKRKIDAVALLKDLPSSVMPHEQEVLKQKEAELQQAQADYQQTQAKLSAAQARETEKLQQLAESLEKARADQQLAIARLQTKKDQRAYTEYEASVTAARRTEERNQAEQSYSRQFQDAEQQRRERDFQVAQISTKIAEVDDKLQTLSTVTSPYSGVIKRLKVVGQNDRNLSVELILSIGSTVSGTWGRTKAPAPSSITPKPNQAFNGSSPPGG